MHKHLDNIFRFSFCIFFLALIAGIYFLVMGQVGYKQALIVGTFASVIVIISAIYEVAISGKITTTNKILWTIFFISFNTLAALIYYLIARKKIKRGY